MKELIAECEGWVRAGRFDKAQAKLQSVQRAKIPRNQAKSFANLCRRTGLIGLGLRTLSPFVRPHKRNIRSTPTPAELAEYAALLLRNDSAEECIRVLNQVDSKAVPEALLYKAFAQFTTWDYAAAIPHLSKYLASDLAPYARAVGQVNLAAALVSSNQLDRALVAIEQSLEESKRENHTRLYANSLELRAQVAIQKTDFVQARKDLDLAREVMGANGLMDFFFITKWTAVIDSLASRKIEPLLEFKAIAKRRQHWETIREVDRYLLRVHFNHDLFEHLLAGTPHVTYRQALQNENAADVASDHYLLGGESFQQFDLETGRFSQIEDAPPLSLHRVLQALLNDLYKPATVGALFSRIFPQENFDIFSSGNRIYQLLYRTRSWLESKNLPMKIVEADGRYSLDAESSLSIKIPFAKSTLGIENLRLTQIRALFAERFFSAGEAAKGLAISQSSCKRLFSWALERGLLERTGVAASTRYRLL